MISQLENMKLWPAGGRRNIWSEEMPNMKIERKRRRNENKLRSKTLLSIEEAVKEIKK